MLPSGNGLAKARAACTLNRPSSRGPRLCPSVTWALVHLICPGGPRITIARQVCLTDWHVMPSTVVEAINKRSSGVGVPMSGGSGKPLLRREENGDTREKVLARVATPRRGSS